MCRLWTVISGYRCWGWVVGRLRDLFVLFYDVLSLGLLSLFFFLLSVIPSTIILTFLCSMCICPFWLGFLIPFTECVCPFASYTVAYLISRSAVMLLSDLVCGVMREESSQRVINQP